MNQPLAAGLAVALVSLAAVIGPALGLSPWWITLFTALALGGLSLDAASYGGRGAMCWRRPCPVARPDCAASPSMKRATN
jgi:hypothetical protein